MVVSRDYMEEKILTVYNGPDWPWKLKKMGAQQVYAIYMRLLNAGKFTSN